MAQVIQKVIRGAILDVFQIRNISWHGNMSPVEFLKELYDIEKMPALDHSNYVFAAAEIKSMSLADDYDPSWIKGDKRFKLLTCPDPKFLKFLSHALYPLVQKDRSVVRELVGEFNTNLRPAGYQLVIGANINRRPVYYGTQIDPLVSLAKEKRKAMVIGASNYKYRKIALLHPKNDVVDMAKKLKKLHFSVRTSIDKVTESTQAEIQHFLKSLKRQDVALLYFTGHGIQVGNKNYLLPIDSVSPKGKIDKRKLISIDWILKEFKNIMPRFAILLLDCCRDNPLKINNREIKKGLAVMQYPNNSFVGFAAGYNQAASDGTGRNGLYTEAILTYISSKSIKIGDVFSRVALYVNDQNNSQSPQYTVSGSGNFYFNK